jgi:hypothetical protein
MKDKDLFYELVSIPMTPRQILWFDKVGGPCFEGNQLDKFGNFPPLSQLVKFRISSNCVCHVG